MYAQEHTSALDPDNTAKTHGMEGTRPEQTERREGLTAIERPAAVAVANQHVGVYPPEGDSFAAETVGNQRATRPPRIHQNRRIAA